MSVELSRRDEILDTAAALFATAGVRASLQQLAEACGILPGSLYHHFDSKEAIFVELVRRYQAELDQVAEQALTDEGWGGGEPESRILTLATSIARCATRHRAAVLLTYFEAPAAATDLAAVAGTDPGLAVRRALVKTLEEARADRYLRSGLDAQPLAELLWQSMVQIAVGAYHLTKHGQRLPELKARLLLHGLAAEPFGGHTGSAALTAAEAVLARWEEEAAADEGDRSRLVLSAARTEFARRGYEVTTVRDIAATAGVSTGTVYRLVASKEELLVGVLGSYVTSLVDGWTEVLGTGATAAEKLDGLLWLNIGAQERFSDEHRIQDAMMGVAPPDNPDLTWSFPAQLRQLKACLSAGAADGSLRPRPAPLDLFARASFALVFTPRELIHELGPTGAHRLARETVLTGAARR